MTPSHPPKTNNLQFLGFVAWQYFRTPNSWSFDLVEIHNQQSCSQRGRLTFHYPCEGNHELHIHAELEPEVYEIRPDSDATLEDLKISLATDTFIRQIVSEVQAYLQLPSKTSWHVDLCKSGPGVDRQDPNYRI